MEGVGVRVPAVEVADDCDTLGIGRPDGEGRAVSEVVRAEFLVEACVRAFVEEVKVKIGEEGVAGHGGGVYGREVESDAAPEREPVGGRQCGWYSRVERWRA